MIIPHTAAESVTLEWDANSEADLAGYKLTYGTTSGAYTETINAGNATTATAANLNAGTTYYFVVTAYNTEGLESLPSNEISYTSSMVNAAPTISTIASQTIGEDTSTGALAFTVGDGETAAGSLTVTGTSSNTALVPNANIVMGGSGASRTVTVTPAAQQNGTASVSVSVSDGALTTASTFLLTVSAVNDAPALSTIASQTIDQDTSTGALAFTVADAETAAGSLTVTGTSSNTALVPNANIVIGGSGASRMVSVTPAAQQNGTASVSVSVSDGALTTTCTFLLTVSAVLPPVLWEIVALSGDLAPGAGGARFSSFASGLRSDAAGGAAFRGNLNSAIGTAGGIWAEANGLLELVAREGSPAPGVIGSLFTAFAASPLWSGTGHLLLNSNLQIGSGGVTLSNDNGLWYKSPSGPLQLVARENGQATGLASGAKFLQLGSNAVLSHEGLYAFTATLQTNKFLEITSANNSGIWTNFFGSPAALARKGDLAPGTRNGATFDTFINAMVSANSSGQIAFRTVLKSTKGVTSASKYGIWMWDGAQLALIVRGGDQAPGTPAGVVFSEPKAPLLRDAILSFHAILTPAGSVTSSNDTGIWVLENGAVTLLAREGSPAPGAPSGAVFNLLPETLAGNDQGDLIFKATLREGPGVTTSNDDGIWARSPGTANAFTLIASEGAPAPQTPAGVVFTTFDAAVVSGGGREAFTANLLAGNGGVTTANDRGLWMRSTTGQLALVLREGDTIAVSQTDIREVSDITLDKSSETGAAGFSGGASINVIVNFTNGSSAILNCTAP